MSKSQFIAPLLGLALLTACGGDGSEAKPNAVPVAAIDPAAFKTRLTGQNVVLDGRPSFDSENSPLSYKWSMAPVLSPASSTFPPELSTPTASVAGFVAYLPGTYTVGLVVNDGSVDSAPAKLDVVIGERAIGTPYTASNELAITLESYEQTTDGTLTITWSLSRKNDLTAARPIPEGAMQIWCNGSVVQSLGGNESLAPGNILTRDYKFSKIENSHIKIIEYIPSTLSSGETKLPASNSLQWVLPAIK